MQEKIALKLFKIGDLVQYTPYYQDDVGPWKMFGDLGIVIDVRMLEDKYQVIKVKWFSDSSELDMSSECLTKIVISDSDDLTNPE